MDKIPTLRTKIVTIFIIVFIIIFFSVICCFYFFLEFYYFEESEKNRNRYENAYNSIINKEANWLAGFSSIIRSDKNFIELIHKKDINRLFNFSPRILDNCYFEYRISNINLYEDTGINFLHMYYQKRYLGKCNNRIISMASSSDDIISGIFYNEEDQYVIASITPILEEEKIIGYLEVEVNLDIIFDDLSSLSGAEIVFMGKKELLDNSNWKNKIDNNKLWGQFDSYVVLNKSDFFKNYKKTKKVEKKILTSSSYI